MQIVITGSLGNIGKPLTGILVRRGHHVTVISSKAEMSPNEVAKAIGAAIGMPHLKWMVISDQEMLDGMKQTGMNSWIANGFIEIQAAQRTGRLYEDFYRDKPALGKVKLSDFARDFAAIYHNQ